MSVKVYNKLVRDRIPEIIRRQGAQVKSHTLTEDQYREALLTKLGEEYQEFVASPNLEELADLIEVIRALSMVLGASPKELEAVRRRKRRERGGFEAKIFLEAVRE